MKKWIIGMALATFAILNLQAQPGPAAERPGGERIQAMRTAFITNRLSLSPEEAQQFWPLFNQFEAEQKKIRDKYRPAKDLLSMTDAEADKFLSSQFEMDQEMLNLKKDYMQRMKKVLPVRKVAMLTRIEQEFREQLLENLQQMRSGQGAGARRPMQRNR